LRLKHGMNRDSVDLPTSVSTIAPKLKGFNLKSLIESKLGYWILGESAINSV
jgi:hypothetical protein